jgi:hypothetical protein
MTESGVDNIINSAGLTVEPDPTKPVNWINRSLRNAPPTARGHIVAALGEFAGTIFFLFFAFAATQ